MKAPSAEFLKKSQGHPVPPNHQAILILYATQWAWGSHTRVQDKGSLSFLYGSPEILAGSRSEKPNS